ncbi:MAG: hypothetical protein K8S25_15065 [Alphaproteobacteria bacterium]|nr:hypothetical protein [Alphaproteobacteria bacterium]
MPPANFTPTSSSSFKAVERTYELARIRLNTIAALPVGTPGRQEAYDDAWEEAELARGSWIEAMARIFAPNDHRVTELTEQLNKKIAQIEQLLAGAQQQAQAFAAISSAISLATQLVRIAALL